MGEVCCGGVGGCFFTFEELIFFYKKDLIVGKVGKLVIETRLNHHLLDNKHKRIQSHLDDLNI